MSNSLTLELDNYPGFYFPGQTVTGRVVLIVGKPNEQIKDFQLRFLGSASVLWQTSVYNNTTHTVMTFPHMNEQVYFDHKIQLNSRPHDGARMNSLPPGRHSFPFVFELPVRIPASYNDTNPKAICRIFYEAQATFRVTGFWKSEVKAVKNLQVRRPIDLNFFPSSARPSVFQDEKYLCCLCCESGPIAFRLTLKKTGFLIGERIQFSAKLINRSKAEITSAEVWISRRVTFRATDGSVCNEILDQDLGSRRTLPTHFNKDGVEVIPVSLPIPNHQQFNSYGCSFMESIYELRIKMIIPCGIDLKGSLPIVIGVVPFIIPPGNPSGTIANYNKTVSESLSPGRNQSPAPPIMGYSRSSPSILIP